MPSGLTTHNLRDGRLFLKDGAGTPNTLEVQLLEGELQFTNAKNRIVVMDRGDIDHVREGDQVPVALSFSFKHWKLYDASTPTPYQFLEKEGPAAGYTSTRAADSDVWCMDLDFYVVDALGGTDEKVAFTDFFATSVQFAEGSDYNKVSVQGQALQVKPTLSATNAP